MVCRIIDVKMYCFCQMANKFIHNVVWKQSITNNITINMQQCKNINKSMFKTLYTSKWLQIEEPVAKALRRTKPKSQKNTSQRFLDMKQVRTLGGKGGDGNVSFLQLLANDCAGPDGGDGGHGGHVIFKVSSNVKDLSHITTVLRAEDGEKGYNKDCFGKNAEHTIVKVPLGTLVRNLEGKIVGDLYKDGIMFIAARGGAGGHGNSFFKSDVQQSPNISEYGAKGEDLQYILEIRSMAHVGMVGLPNAGKSTLLRAISRAKPKVAPYPFTTLKPHIGMILYDDYEQIAVADLPGLIANSHKNRGLGIQFLKHVERCAGLLFILDITADAPWVDFETLRYEITQFNVKLSERSLIIVANKMDLPKAEENLEILKQKLNLPIIPISAKMGTNVSTLLKEIKIIYDQKREESEKENEVQNSEDSG